MKDEKEICNECGESVKFGSGNYVNRESTRPQRHRNPFRNGKAISKRRMDMFKM